MCVELISLSPFYCNENATKETTQEEHFSEYLFWVHVFKTANSSTFNHS